MNFGKKSLLVVSTVAVLGLVLSLGPAVVGGQGGSTLFLPLITRAQTAITQLIQLEDNILISEEAEFAVVKCGDNMPCIVDTKTGTKKVLVLYAGLAIANYAWPGAANIEWLWDEQYGETLLVRVWDQFLCRYRPTRMDGTLIVNQVCWSIGEEYLP